MIEQLDHFVLFAKDLDETVNFYKRLGFEVKPVDSLRVALCFGNQQINVVAEDVQPPSHIIMPRRQVAGTLDLCFIVSAPVDEIQGVEVVQGPVEREGAVGRLLSIYFYDPNGNLIELANRF